MKPHAAVAFLLSVLLVPLMLAGVVVVATALLGQFTSYTYTWQDYAFGGAYSAYLQCMIGGVVAALSWTVVKWAWTGRFEVPNSTRS